MFRVIGCITQQHDIRLVLVAVAICCFACFTTINMLWRSASHRGSVRAGWIIGAAVVFSFGVWATHFVAMLAFDSALVVGYEEVLTGFSFLMAAIGSVAAFSLLIRGRDAAVDRGLAGLVAGLAITTMHFTGAGAIRVHGTIVFDFHYVVAAIICGTGCAVLALIIGGKLDQAWRRNAAAAVLALSVIVTHFTGMTAVQIRPGIAAPAVGVLIESSMLVALVISVVALILIMGMLGSVIDREIAARFERGQSSLHHVQRHDPLTGLPNRLQSLTRLTEMIEGRPASGSTIQGVNPGAVAVFLLDLDQFKQVNDLLGHKAGDALLIESARRLQALLTPQDLLGRADGDSFIVAVTAAEGRPMSATLAMQIIGVLSEPFITEERQIRIGATVGIASFPQDGDDAGVLLQNADTALHQAKEDGRGLYRFFEASMNEQLTRRQLLEQDLRQAISERQLELHYQPLLDGRSGEVAGFEALARWNDPKRGAVPPLEFITVAEETGLISALGRWVLETACAEAVTWDRPLSVAVNLSTVQFRQPDLAEMIVGILERTGLVPWRLELEVTESVLIQHAEQAVAVLTYLRDRGVRISLDDFGTGYSSLNYLRQLPLHKIKIDRSFVQGLGQDNEAAVITRAIIALGHSLSLQVTAEGVETETQFAFLQAESCNQMQGYLIGKPAASSGISHLTSVRPRTVTADKEPESIEPVGHALP